MRKTARKMIVLLILIAIATSLVVPVHGKYFSDVKRSELGTDKFDAINYLTDNGFMNGMSADKFEPNTLLTRGMFVTLLYRYSGSSEHYSNSFTDVSSDRYYYWAVGWAAHYGIVNGMTTTTFVPNGYLTREQALTILHRFGTSYKGMSYPRSSNITSHSDYSSVSNYARKAVSWAKAYDIWQPTSNTAKINPKESIKRSEAALFIARFSFHAEEIPTRDKFSFKNNKINFYSTEYGQYFMNVDMINRLKAMIKSKYSASTAEEMEKAMFTNLNNEWGGSCHGMSMVVLLDKLGKIEFNKNFGNANSMNQVAVPKNNRVAESAINFYQITFSLKRSFPSYSVNNSNLATGIRDLVAHVAAHGPTIFNYYWTLPTGKTAGHSIIVLSIANTASGRYSLRVIDPNETYISTLTLENNSSGVTFYDNKITAISYYTANEIQFWDDFDLDGAYNDLNRRNQTASIRQDQAASKEEIENIYDDSVCITVPYQPFVIHNASGEELICDGSNLSGSMPVLDALPIPGGPDYVAKLQLTVPYSDAFTCSKYDSASNFYFYASAPSYYGGFSGTNVESATVSTDNSVALTGQEMDYRITVSPPTDTLYFYNVSGHAPSDVSLKASEANLQTFGMSEPHTITFKNTDALQEVTVIAPMDRETTTITAVEANQKPILNVTNADGSKQQVTVCADFEW